MEHNYITCSFSVEIYYKCINCNLYKYISFFNKKSYYYKNNPFIKDNYPINTEEPTCEEFILSNIIE